MLAHPGNSPVSRMAAGLQLKNQLTSKDENVKLKFQAQWLQLPEDIRNYVKKNVSSLILYTAYHVLINCHYLRRY